MSETNQAWVTEPRGRGLNDEQLERLMDAMNIRRTKVTTPDGKTIISIEKMGPWREEAPDAD